MTDSHNKSYIGRNNHNSGFTIVELLVVIVVMGILSALSYVSYSGVRQKAVEASLKSDLANASKQLALYQTIYAAYPTTIDNNMCPVGPMTDVSYCFKASPGNTIVYSSNNYANPQIFNLTAVNTNGTSYTAHHNATPTFHDGLLTNIGYIATGAKPYNMVLSLDGASAYTVNYNSNSISMYKRNSTTGLLSPLITPTISTGTNPFDIAISSDGTSVYAVNRNSNYMSMYKRDIDTGALSSIGTVAGDNGQYGIVITKDGTSVYTASYVTNNIYMYSRDLETGILTPLAQPQLSTTTKAYGIVVSPDGAFAYATTYTPAKIITYRRDINTGMLSYLSEIGCDIIPYHISISADGSFLHLGANGLSQYRRNVTTGALSLVEKNEVNLNPCNLGISPDGLSIYTGRSTAAEIFTFKRNIISGSITRIEKNTIDSTDNTCGVAISSDGRFAYATSINSNKINIYQRD